MPRDTHLHAKGRMSIAYCLSVALLAPAAAQEDPTPAPKRKRARDHGIVVGVLEPGLNNAITDIAGVQVGHATVTIKGDDSVQTGITAVIPHPGDVYNEPVPAAIHPGNGYGKLTGETQVRELGEIETPILLTNTLAVWRVAEELKRYLLNLGSEAEVRQHTINPVVGETNDGFLNDMWHEPPVLGYEQVAEALTEAHGGQVEEGSVGAGRGTQGFGFKGGIGTSSRVLPQALGAYSVGVLVQTNFDGILTINGAPVGRALGKYQFRDELEGTSRGKAEPEDGSIMVVVATDAPLSSRNLGRLANRAMLGLARTGSFAANGSGEYVIAFSTNREVRRKHEVTYDPKEDRFNAVEPQPITVLHNVSMSPLFLAVVEATEEAVYNALFMATDVSNSRGEREALPVQRTLDILDLYGARSLGGLRPHGEARAGN